MMMTDSKEDQQASWSALVEAEKLAVEYKKKIGGNKKAMDSAAANELLDAKVVCGPLQHSMHVIFYLARVIFSLYFSAGTSGNSHADGLLLRGGWGRQD